MSDELMPKRDYEPVAERVMVAAEIASLVRELTELPRTVKIDEHRSAFLLGNDLRTRLIAALTRPTAASAGEVERQIDWTLGEPPKDDGVVVYGHVWAPYRWKAYKPNSEQARHGIKGRWQAMNEYGGWDNAKAPDEWATEGLIKARTAIAALRGQEGG